MKKIILIASIAMSALLHAQDKKVTFGVKAGANFANVTGNAVKLFTTNGSENVSSRTGVMIGAFTAINLSEKFSLQSELLYSQQGFKSDYYNNELKVNLDYINIPILAKYVITDGLSIALGPQIGFLINSKAKVPIREAIDLKPVKKVDNVTEVKLDDQFKSTDFGLNFGAGYQLDNGLGINARYTLGLTDIFDFSNTVDNINKVPTKRIAVEDNYELKNRVFSISLFYTF